MLTLKHGNVISSYNTSFGYINGVASQVIINYKNNATIQGGAYISVSNATIQLIGVATYANSYLFDRHDNAANNNIQITGVITVTKLINANWKNKLYLIAETRINVTNEIGTVNSPSASIMVVRCPSVINQTNPGSELILGGACTIDIESQLYSNNTNHPSTTFNHLNSSL